MKLKKESKSKLLEFKNPFFEDFGKKILAIVISILLWIVANLEFDIEKSIDIPIRYSNLSPELAIVNEPQQKINIRLRGPRSQISTITNTNTALTIDLSNFVNGFFKVEIQDDFLKLPREIQVTGVSPAEIDVEIDKVIEKEVVVKPDLKSADEGFKIKGKPTISPKTVQISGPKKIISDIEVIETNPISLVGEKSKFSIQVPLQIPSLINIKGTNLVRVTVDIEEINLEKEFDELDISFKNFDDLKYSTDDKTKANLVFDGPYSIINNLNSKDIEVFVDGESLNETSNGTHKLKVKVNYPHPESLKLTKITPKSIQVKIN